MGEQMNKMVQAEHAARYPQGCRATYSTMCEDCCARIVSDAADSAGFAEPGGITSEELEQLIAEESQEA